jgi:hypothetical protein
LPLISQSIKVLKSTDFVLNLNVPTLLYSSVVAMLLYENAANPLLITPLGSTLLYSTNDYDNLSLKVLLGASTLI